MEPSETTSGYERTASGGSLDLAREQMDQELKFKRAELALRAWRMNTNGTAEFALSLDEVRAVLLPALGLPADKPA